MNNADRDVGQPSESRSRSRNRVKVAIAIAQIVLSINHFFVGNKAPRPEIIKSYPLSLRAHSMPCHFRIHCTALIPPSNTLLYFSFCQKSSSSTI